MQETGLPLQKALGRIEVAEDLLRDAIGQASSRACARC